MTEDRTIAPGASRRRDAWRAGLRPRIDWLWPTMMLVGLAIAVQPVWVAPVTQWADIRPGAVQPDAWLAVGSRWLGWGWIGAAVLLIIGGLVARQIGGISAAAQRKLRADIRRPSVIAWVGIASIVALGLTAGMLGVLAAAARSVDASEAGLAALWRGWVGRVGVGGVVALGVASVGAAIVDRQARHRQLAQTSAQVRDEARDTGAR